MPQLLGVVLSGFAVKRRRDSAHADVLARPVVEKQALHVVGLLHLPTDGFVDLFNERRVVLSSRPTIVAGAISSEDRGWREDACLADGIQLPAIIPCQDCSRDEPSSGALGEQRRAASIDAPFLRPARPIKQVLRHVLLPGLESDIAPLSTKMDRNDGGRALRGLATRFPVDFTRHFLHAAHLDLRKHAGPSGRGHLFKQHSGAIAGLRLARLHAGQ
mmetsp:Transcript_118440/g.166511  ORF Transcript_118440/g.166511 Transcript_118440/m.166511 type:complete len:217 (-) Transcript_118440:624-1274(-)